MTNKIDHDDRNVYIVYNFIHGDDMISSLAKVTGLQSHLLLEKTGAKNVRKKIHDSGVRKYIQCDRSVDIRRITCYFEYWRPTALGIRK